MTRTKVAAVPKESSDVDVSISKDTPICIPGLSEPVDISPPKDKVAIVGFSPSTRNEAPFSDPTFEFWGMNSLFQFLPGPWHRWFEMHDYAHWEKIHKEQWPKIREFFKTCGLPLYTTKEFKEFPTSVAYPLQEVVDNLGLEDIKGKAVGDGLYFESTVAYAIGLALTLPWVKEIHLYGIDMVHDTEYSYQRPNTEFFLGIAQGRGIKIHLPETCALLKGQWLYGYETKPGNVYLELSNAVGIRIQELMGILNSKQESCDKAMYEKIGHECALQEAHHMQQFLIQVARGRKVTIDDPKVKPTAKSTNDTK